MKGRVRIIAGAFKGRRIQVADLPGLRPTADRVRETLFNWLRDRIEGARCLDLFAGSGALGFEAASRGAREVVMVEASAAAARLLASEAARIHAETVSVVEADAMRWIERPASSFDVILIDPPYRGAPAAEAVLARLDERGWVRPGGVAYLEGARALGDAELPPGWAMLRCGKAGKVRYHLAARG